LYPFPVYWDELSTEEEMMRISTRAPVAAIVLLVLLWVSSIVSADSALLLSERWTATFHDAWDTARDIDGNRWGVVVVGTSGLAVYDANGQEMAVVVTDDAQHAVRLVDRVAYVAGERGVTAYSLDGEMLWSLSLPEGSRALAVMNEQLLILTAGRLMTCSLEGSPQGEISIGFNARAIDSQGDVVAAVGERQVALLAGGSILWQRTLPFPASDVAVDAWDGIWVVGEQSLARLSQASGAMQWMKRLQGVGTAVAATLLPGEVTPGVPEVMVPGVVVVGYRVCETGHDFMSALVSRDGALLWQAFHSSGQGDDMAYGVTSLPNGDIVVTGVSPFAQDPESEDDYLTICYTLASQDDPSAGSGVPCDHALPTVDFTWQPGNPRAFDRIVFSSQAEAAQGSITSWWWSFDEPHRGVGRTKEHRFLRSGWYDITLRVEDCARCAATITKSIYIENRPPEVNPTTRPRIASGELVADFDWRIEREQRGSYPEGFSSVPATDVDDLQFQDRSTGSSPLIVEFEAGARDLDGRVTHIEWEFGDGARSEASNPCHTYAAPGTYEVIVRATDDEGAVTTVSFPVSVEATGSIVSWEWEIDGPGDYLNGSTPLSQHPVFGFTDDSSEGSFEVTLTIADTGGATASATRWIPIANVPPTAEFSHAFTGEPILPPADEVFWGGEGNHVMCAPNQPATSGVVAFTDQSFDGEPWLEIASRLWEFEGEHECREGGESCHTSDNPHVLFSSDGEGEGGRRLFRGTRVVTLEVWDDDSARSAKTGPVHIANIAPYAGFEWMHDPWSWSSTTPTCSGGDSLKSGFEGPLTATREIESWETGDAVFVPWGWGWTAGQVTLSVSGGIDSVEIEETVPDGWTIEYWGEDLAVIGNSLLGTIFLGEGEATVQYEISPPSDETATPGVQTIQGAFTGRTGGGEEEDPEEVHHLSLDSQVVLCTTVDVETDVEFRAYGDEDTRTGSVDPNGDPVSFAWDFGPQGTDTAQWVWLNVQLLGVQAQYVDWDWMWSGSVPARLTVTDSQGASTSVDTSVDVEGYCSGGAPS
jgi:PKD repeat protein